MTLVDFDGMFDEKITQYVKESKKKRSSKAWEDIIPKLYKQFGDTYIAKIKCTPTEYYAKMSTEALVNTLSAHVENGLSVPEFLINELEKREAVDELLPLLDVEGATRYAMNLLGGDPRAFDKYFSILENEGADEELKGEIVTILSEHADEVKSRILEYYKKKTNEEYALAILSRVRERDEEVYKALIDGFSSADAWSLALRAGYLAAYGDERALPVLLQKITDTSIGFVEFQELKYAIEALGGEYWEERDFSADKDYIKVEEAKEKSAEDNK